jgi:hypothetical protein
MELRSYMPANISTTTQQRNQIMTLVRDHLAQGQDIDGTFEFRFMKPNSDLDYCEYDYVLVIDMGYSEAREQQKVSLASKIGKELSAILDSKSLAVRLRLQNAGFVPYPD